jgi:hypothetical protein
MTEQPSDFRLRVHAVGTAFGRNSDQIDVEAVFQVDYDVPAGKTNGVAMRVWIKAPTGPVVGGPVSTTRAVVDRG